MTDATDTACLDAFVALVGREAWQSRIDAIVASQPLPGRTSHHGRDVLRRHAVEIAIERGRRPVSTRPAATQPDPRRLAADLRLRRLTADALALHARLPRAGQARFEARLADAMLDGQSLFPLFHLLRTASLHRARGFEVDETGLHDAAPFDLRIERGGQVAEVACSTVSAESGRDVHRDAWFRLADMVGPDLQTWLSAHPGRYLLNMTLPRGLRRETRETREPCALAELHGRIKAFLAAPRRQDHDDAVVMRLDTLNLAGIRAEEVGIVSDLRQRFGPDAHLAVTVVGAGVFVMAAQASRANDVPAAVRRRLEALAPERFTGTCPAIIALFVGDTELGEWRRLQRDLSLEGEVRQFLATNGARNVAAVACSSRHEILDAEDDAAEIRFRSPLRSVGRLEALAPSITSSIGMM